MLLALAVASAGLLLAAPAAGAAPAALPYPSTTCPTLAVSTTTPLVGASITVTGSKFANNADVRLELHTTVYVLGHVTTSATGTFQTTVTLPAGVVGAHELQAIGGGANADPGCPPDPIQIINIHAGASAAANGGGGTAFTGVDVLLLVLVAALLLGAGVVLNRSGRKGRRRTYADVG
ncbi:MAG: hypothetical protein QOC66_4349 [Pseudonocardiales bacterium]|jgi:hypothetical protein|nr:hypothetical protein [Pseudonocardiales bacterium]